MPVTEATNHDTFLSALGFNRLDRNFSQLMVLPHPADEKLTLVAFQHRGSDGTRLDLFTEYKESSVSYPLNTPGDPRNICLGIPDHNPAFVATMVTAVVGHFKGLEV